MTEPSFALPLSHPLRVAALGKRAPTRFHLRPDAKTQARIAESLGISAVHGLTFQGEVRPSGRNDLVLEGQLRASVVQPCDITLAPVTTRIDAPVLRRYLSDYAPPKGEETEMPEDDSAEPLPEVIDAGAVAIEALVLALPLYPRAPGAELGEAVFAAPGSEPLRDGDLRPFAGLAALKGRLTTPDPEEEP